MGVRALLGFRPSPIWGIAPADIGVFLQSFAGDRPRASTLSTGQHHPRKRGLFHVPKPRHKWGVPQYALHASWGDLFLDLIFVGVAFKIGDTIKDSFFSCGDTGYGGSSGYGGNGSTFTNSSTYGRHLAAGDGGDPADCVGLGYGVLYSAALFASLFFCWNADVQFRGRFEAADTAHRLLDEGQYLLMVVSASNIRPVASYLSKGLGSFILPLVVYISCWSVRMGETSLFAHKEMVRRFSGALLLEYVGVALWWLAAYLAHEGYGFVPGVASPYGSSGTSSDDTGGYAGRRQLASSGGDGADDTLSLTDAWVAPLLLLIGAHWVQLRTMWRSERPKLLTPKDRAVYLSEWPAQRTRVPLNVEYVAHRYMEFMMLMIGERRTHPHPDTTPKGARCCVAFSICPPCARA